MGGFIMKIRHLSVFGAAVLCATSSFAGDTLRLQSGAIQIQDESKELLVQSFGSSLEAQSGTEKYFVVQFAGPIGENAESQLSEIGLETLRYLPEDAYLVRGNSRFAAIAGSKVDGVRAVVPYKAEWKVSDEFSGGGARISDTRVEQVLISTLDQVALTRVARAAAALPGVAIRGHNDRDLVIETFPSQISRLAQIEGIEWIQKLPLLVTWDLPMDSESLASSVKPVEYKFTGHESGTRLMKFDSAWMRGFQGEGQVVAVGDTGLDTGNASTIHPDFVGNLLKGYPIGLGSTSWEDPMGHGTHVAGSVLGNGRSSSDRIRGGAYRANLVVMGLWSSILDNLAPGTDFNKIIGTAYKDGARVHTNSWGAAANFGSYDTMASRVDEYMWNNPDMLVLFAAGNSGVDSNRDGRIDENSVGTPGTAKNVLTVGASENELLVGGIQRKLGELREGDKKWGVEPLKSDTLSNNGNGIAAFSSRGPTNDGRIKPEVVAPGTNIISVRSKHPKAQLLWGAFDDNYVYSGGTSMSTPLVAGAAAVTREYLVKSHRVSSPSAALVKATLMHTARDLYPGQYGTGAGQELPTVRPNIHEGYGLVDMDQATKIGSETVLVDDKTGVGLNEEKMVTVSVRNGGALRVTLTYTDAPGTASAAKALVNDLDVKVVGPNRAVKTLADRVNNSEMIEMKNLAAGDYQVIVTGVNVPRGKNGKQPYALLVSQVGTGTNRRR